MELTVSCGIKYHFYMESILLRKPGICDIEGIHWGNKNCLTWRLYIGSCHPIYQYTYVKFDTTLMGEVRLVEMILKSGLSWWIQLVTWCSTWEGEHSKREIKLIPWELPVWIRLLIHKCWISSHSNRRLF